MRACYRKYCLISHQTTKYPYDELPNKECSRCEEYYTINMSCSVILFNELKERNSMSDKSQEEHKYDMKSNWVKEKIVTIEIEGKKDFHVATPPDFWSESPKELLSPEDLFVASAVSCFGVTLVGVAKRFHAEFKDFHVSATGTLDKGEYGWEFDQITISAKIIVTTEKDKKRMEKAAERAHRYCLVANSMKCPSRLISEVIIE